VFSVSKNDLSFLSGRKFIVSAFYPNYLLQPTKRNFLNNSNQTPESII